MIEEDYKTSLLDCDQSEVDHASCLAASLRIQVPKVSRFEKVMTSLVDYGEVSECCQDRAEEDVAAQCLVNIGRDEVLSMLT